MGHPRPAPTSRERIGFDGFERRGPQRKVGRGRGRRTCGGICQRRKGREEKRGVELGGEKQKRARGARGQEEEGGRNP